MSQPFASSPPSVRLVSLSDRPFEHAVAAARTCYSGRGVVTADEVSGVGLPPDKQQQRQDLRDRIAHSTFRAGHHTTLQHGFAQFALDGVSRQFVWSFLHAHPFYNSEQTSQRYVEVKPGRVAVPALPDAARRVFQQAVERQMADYHALAELLEPVAAQTYFAVFPARAKDPQKWRQPVQRRAQEVARYVLPVATHTSLVHTVNILTVLRYRRLCLQPDTPREARFVVDRMAELLFEADPLLRQLDVEPLEPIAQVTELVGDPQRHRQRIHAFDAELAGRTSVLIDRFAHNERRVADAVREVLGVLPTELDDAAAIATVLDPQHNPLLADPLANVSHQKLGRALHAAHYAFRKRLSHAADSQDQRHRMTPAARPSVHAFLSPEPDFVTPGLVTQAGPQAVARYTESMQRTWTAIAELQALGVDAEWRAYLLPNAVALRFTETADLAALRHKHWMRLCFNAQEEIWQASVDEAQAIAEVEPNIGRYLLPPCAARHLAGIRPYCTEGDRFCGVKVWLQDRAAWRRSV
jgi:flavin-dependent thymidylate synthase